MGTYRVTYTEAAQQELYRLPHEAFVALRADLEALAVALRAGSFPAIERRQLEVAGHEVALVIDPVGRELKVLWIQKRARARDSA